MKSSFIFMTPSKNAPYTIPPFEGVMLTPFPTSACTVDT